MMLNEENQSNVSKENYRQKIWENMMNNELVNFPSIIYNRIPNFKGADQAAKRLSELDQFKNARVIKINPDKPQEPVRLLALEAGKDILVPIPRLKSGLFLHVTSPELEKDKLKVVATRHGLQKYGKPLGVDTEIKVDLVISGAVCVSRQGYKIGKGEGFADLEFAMMMRMGAVSDETIVITTIHDTQLVDDLPPELFQKHDVPVDIIVTPTQTIIVNERLRKPVGIFWDILTPKRVKTMPILQQLKLMDEKEGKNVTLRIEEAPRRKFTRHIREKKDSNTKREDTTMKAIDAITNAAIGRVGIRRRMTRRRQPRRQQSLPKEVDDENSPVTESNENVETKTKNKTSRHKPVGFRSKPHIDFSLKLSNINSDVRVRDLKNALSERGVRPSDITWRGHRGFCIIHFGKLRNKDSMPNQPLQVDAIVANLQQLRIGEVTKSSDKKNDYIIVEPAEPITRIEITDVTAV